jgi:hypothetical protein
MNISGLVCVAIASLIFFQNAPAGAAERSKLKTAAVTLYDSGLAQLVDKAVVRGAERLRMEVPLAYLDDLIASLYFTSTGNVKIRGLNYPTVENLGQAVHASSIGQALSSAEHGEVMLPEQLSAYAKALVGTNVAVMLKNQEGCEHQR